MHHVKYVMRKYFNQNKMCNLIGSSTIVEVTQLLDTAGCVTDQTRLVTRDGLLADHCSPFVLCVKKIRS